MAPGKTLLRLTITLLLGLIAACSGSSSGGGGIALNSVSQDLTVDPTGQTTVLTFSKNAPGSLTVANFEANGGQTATGIVINAKTVTVTWDDIVSPADQVRGVGVSGLPALFVPVTSTDAAAPTFTITGATQVAGLGGDTISVQFSGARVQEATAELAANWTLTVNGQNLDLTGSVFTLNPGTQVLDVTLGSLANLHASFDLAATVNVLSVADTALATTAVTGAATGDAVAPTLVSAEQNLTESEFGFVVDFTFSEAMDPVFSVGLSSFDAGFPVFASTVEQPTEDVLRVTFSNPIVPGIDTVDLSSIVDAHGNAFPDVTQAIAAGSTVANDFAGSGPVVTTVENSGGDTIVATFDQAVDPDTAEEFGRWRLESPTATPIDLTNATFSYDLLTKSLTITLVDDDLVTGDTFTFGAASSSPFPVDVDGEDFTTVFAGSVTGDVVLPTVSSFTQNRGVDTSGLTYDVTLSEDVGQTEAETTTNYVFSNGATVTSATLMAGLNVVRVEIDDLAVPGQHTVDVMNLTDLAGNSMAVASGEVIDSTDTTVPTPTLPTAYAVEGTDDDTVTVVFDDDMIPSEVEDANNWVLESPTGTMLDPSNGSVVYTAGTRTAVLTLDGGDDLNLKRDDSFSVGFLTMHDVGGNLVDATLVAGSVDSETNFPVLEHVWAEASVPNNVHVQFSEPCDLFDDAGTTYTLRDGGGFDIGGGTPTVTVDADRLGATLSFGAGVTPGTHTIDVWGVTDTVGNQMFPTYSFPITAEDSNEPALDTGLQIHQAISGEDNDELTVVFDRPVRSWNLFDPTNWSLTDGVTPADFTGADFVFDGTDTVTVTFDTVNGYSFDNNPYTLTVDNLNSMQGIAMTGASVDSTAAHVSTDVAGPTLTRARLDAADSANSVLIELNEALDATDAVDTSNYAISAVNPDTVTQVGRRTVRATWSGGVSAGQTVDVTTADLADNPGLTSGVIQAVDSSGPIVIFVGGTAVSGTGEDEILVTYNEPVDPSTGLLSSNYTITMGGSSVDLTSAAMRYVSATNTVHIQLPASIDLDVANTINVQVSGVLNHAALTINPPANVNGTITGDLTAPDFVAGQAFVNYRQDAGSTIVDLMLDEDVDVTFATTTTNWTVSGGQSVTTAELVDDSIVRLTLDVALGATDTVSITGLPDVAGNAAGLISIQPNH